MGVRYQYLWRCIHCKSADHPASLCPHTRRARAGGEPTDDAHMLDDDLLPPPPKPTLGPSNRPQNPNRGKRMNNNGKGTAPGNQQNVRATLP